MEFSRKPARTEAINVRVTAEQKAILTGLADALGVVGQSEVLRVALDYYVKHSPEARAAMKALAGKKAAGDKGLPVGPDAEREG